MSPPSWVYVAGTSENFCRNENEKPTSRAMHVWKHAFEGSRTHLQPQVPPQSCLLSPLSESLSLSSLPASSPHHRWERSDGSWDPEGAVVCQPVLQDRPSSERVVSQGQNGGNRTWDKGQRGNESLTGASTGLLVSVNKQLVWLEPMGQLHVLDHDSCCSVFSPFTTLHPWIANISKQSGRENRPINLYTWFFPFLPGHKVRKSSITL